MWPIPLTATDGHKGMENDLMMARQGLSKCDGDGDDRNLIISCTYEFLDISRDDDGTRKV